MHFCIFKIHYFVLANGEASGFFSSSRLCQGDPLSPHLIILVMETLSRLVNNIMEAGFLEGFQITNAQSESMLISH